MPGSNNHSTMYDDELQQQQAGEQTIVPPQEESTATATPPKTNDGGVSSYDDIITNLEDEIAKNEKRYNEERKIDAVVAAINGIGDMGRALGNIYATTQYAPNAYNPSTADSAKYGERAARAKSEYEKRRDAMMNYLRTAKKDKQNFDFAQQKAKQQNEYRAEQLRLRGEELALRANKLTMAKDENEWRHGLEEMKLAIREREADIREAYNNGRLSQAQQRIEMQRLTSIKHQLQEYEENYEYDPKTGKVLKRTRTVKDPAGGGEGGAQGGGKPNPMGGSPAQGNNGKKQNPMR